MVFGGWEERGVGLDSPSFNTHVYLFASYKNVLSLTKLYLVIPFLRVKFYILLTIKKNINK